MTLPQKYTRIAVVLHWLIALGVIVNVSLIWSTDFIAENSQRPIIDTHKSIGITVLGLALLRLLWRLTHRPPELPAGYSGWERTSARLVHITLYVLIFALPLSGWMHDSAWKAAASHPMHLFGIIPWPRIGPILNADPSDREMMHTLFGDIHTCLAYVLYALFVLHLGAALKHQFIDREKELQRMLP